MKAATREELAANPLDPQPAGVTVVHVPHGQSVSGEVVEAALAEHRPMWAFMAHWETGSGRLVHTGGNANYGAAAGRGGIVEAPAAMAIPAAPAPGLALLA